MKRIEKLRVMHNDRLVGLLSLTPDNRLCAFEYDRQWIDDGFSISPLELPLKAGLFVADALPFNGNFGVFEDSLPDGYGRYLLHKVLAKQGISDSSMSALDKLSIVGNGGFGALRYLPATDVYETHEERDLDCLQRMALDVLGERNDEDASLLLYNSRNSGGCRPKALLSDDEGHWLVKFRHTYDPLDMGVMEFHYNEVARRCGINVADCRLMNGKYFASRRFDISPEGERLHVVTAGGLLRVSIAEPGAIDYGSLLALTGYITQNEADVREMFRRMVFNYLTDNKDDHCKNFSFMCVRSGRGRWTWKLAPAYDLTYFAEGYNGEHATAVNGTCRPCADDFVAAGTKIRMDEKVCRSIIDEVRCACGDILRHDIF